MPTYTTFLTEEPNNHVKREYRGYEISGVGVVFNTCIKVDNVSIIVDKEIFVSGATLANFSGMSWTTVEEEDLGEGQTRYVRTYGTGTPGMLIEVMRTITYDKREQPADANTIVAV